MSKKRSYYYFRQGATPRQFICVKLDSAFAVDDVYHQEIVSPVHTRCDCVAGQFEKKACRHAVMLRIFQEQGKIGARVLFDYKANVFLTSEEEKSAA